MHLTRTGFICPEFKEKLFIFFIEYIENFNTGVQEWQLRAMEDV